MLSRKTVVGLFACASLYAATAAAAQTARVVKYEAPPAAEAAPRANWADVRVEFEGNKVFNGEQLSGTVTRCYERFRNGKEEFNFELLDYCVKTDVRELLLRSGYVRAQVGEPRAEKWGLSEKISVSLEENEFYRLGEVRIEGAEHFDAARLRGLLPLEEKEIADAVAVTRWLSEHVRRMYGDDGYIQYEYEVRPEFKRDPGAGEGVVDFAVKVVEGRRFTVRSIRFAGVKSTPEETLRAAMLFKEGDVFGSAKLADSIGKLNGLGLFKEIDPDNDTEFRLDEESGALELTIRLVETSGESPR